MSARHPYSTNDQNRKIKQTDIPNLYKLRNTTGIVQAGTVKIESGSTSFTGDLADEVRKLLAAGTDLFQEIVDGVIAAATDFAEDLREYWESLEDGDILYPVKQFLEDPVGYITTNFQSAWDSAVSAVEGVVADISAAITAWWHDLYEDPDGALYPLKLFVDRSLAGINEFLADPIDYLTSLANNAWDAAVRGVTGVVQDIVAGITEWWNTTDIQPVKWIRDTLVPAARDTIDWVITTFGDAAQALWSTLEGIGATVLGNLTAFFDDPVGYITSNFQSAWDSAILTLTDTVTGITAAITQWWRDIYETRGGALYPLKLFVDNVLDEVNSFVSNPGAYLTRKITDFGNFVTESFLRAGTWVNNNIITPLRNTLDGIYQSASDLAADISSWVTSNAQTIFNSISSAISGTYLAIADIAGRIATDITNWYRSNTPISNSLRALVGWWDGLARDIGHAVDSTIKFIFGDTGSTATGGSQGDIDMKTFDLRNVDRIYFNSNDAIDFATDHAHITSSGAGSNNDLWFFAPDRGTYHFYTGRSGGSSGSGPASEIFLLTPSLAKIVPDFQLGGTLEVRAGTAAVDGDISKVGSDIVVRTGGKSVNLSNLGSGDGGGTPSDSVRIPIIFTSGTLQSYSASTMGGVFGNEPGAMGILTNSAVTSIEEPSFAYLYVRREGTWLAFQLHNQRVSSVRTLSGTAYIGGPKGRVKITSDNTDDASLSTVGNVEGRIAVHVESDDPDDGELVVVDNNNLARKGAVTSRDKPTTTISLSSSRSLPLIDVLPTISLSTVTGSGLDSAFGNAEGSMGYNKTTDDLYIKLNGYWWRINL